MECPGCHFAMSFTEIARGQHWCNRCESLTARKLCAGMTNYRPGAENEFAIIPVPEFDPYSYLSPLASQITRNT